MLKIKNLWQVTAGLSGLIGVAAGAAGAHAVADAAAAALIEKASIYQLIHTLALLWLATMSGRPAQLARVAFLGGIALFCGSLYLKGFGLAIIAPFAPVGGTLFMIGWAMVIIGSLYWNSVED